MKTIKKHTTFSFIEKHSKFISIIDYVESKNDIKDLLTNMKKTYKDANHVVYAYRLINGEYKFSDANEPQNSAGKPIYNIIERNDLYNNLITVIRYFGGIKLGIGRLVRAYSYSASSLIKKSNILNLYKAEKIQIIIDYKHFNILKNIISNTDKCRIIDEVYAENIVLTIVCITDNFRMIKENNYIKDYKILTSSFFPF